MAELNLRDLFYEVAAVVGADLQDYAFILYGSEVFEEFQPDFDTCWVGTMEAGTVRILRGGHGHLRGLWRSPQKHLYVAGRLGEDPHAPRERGVFRGTRDAHGAYRWDLIREEGNTRGVWGLHDEYVFAWSFGAGTTTMSLWNGQSWAELESPGEVVSMHGIAPDLIYACGHRGLIARWDGSRWSRVANPAQGTVSSVFVRSEEEMYATAAGQLLLEGARHGWGTRLVASGPLDRVVVLGDDVWVTSATLGLSRLDEDALVDPIDTVRGWGAVPGDGCVLVYDGSLITELQPDKTVTSRAPIEAKQAIREGRTPWVP
ncbi:MAG: hypothetical protein AAGF12_09405 [Myxococcota bacterium]